MSDLNMTKRQKMVISGKFHERNVALEISNTIPCKIILNFEVYSRDLRRGTEVDIVVITPYKIYCIECKNYKGYIAGNKFDYYWTFASSGKRGRTQNPYLLNRKHIRLLRGCFYNKGLTPLLIENIIVVPDACKIHVEGCNVVNLSSLISLLDLDRRTSTPIYNVNGVYRFLESINYVRVKNG